MENLEVTHYEVLGISKELLEEAKEPQQLVKRAYRRALLRHHPDKSAAASSAASASASAAAGLGRGRVGASGGVSGPTSDPATPAPATIIFTVDQISTAFAVLSDPSRRKEYDARRLTLVRSAALSSGGGGSGVGSGGQPCYTPGFQTGIETVDLDDLDSDPDGSVWWRSCRCGNSRGFELGEDDLEAVADLGELIVGCRDCSLWLKVHFAFLQDEEAEG